MRTAPGFTEYRIDFRPDYWRAHFYRISWIGCHISCPFQSCQIPQARSAAPGLAHRPSLADRRQGALQGDAMWSWGHWIDSGGGDRSGGCFQVERDKDAVYRGSGVKQSGRDQRKRRARQAMVVPRWARYGGWKGKQGL